MSTMAPHPDGLSGSVLTVAQATAYGKVRMAGEALAACPSGSSPPTHSSKGWHCPAANPLHTRRWGSPRCLPPLRPRSCPLQMLRIQTHICCFQRKISFGHETPSHGLIIIVCCCLHCHCAWVLCQVLYKCCPCQRSAVSLSAMTAVTLFLLILVFPSPRTCFSRWTQSWMVCWS